jgi:hypothetical protein
LEEPVCAVIDVLPDNFQNLFMVFDYGMYPPLTYIDRGEAHETAFNCMVQKVETVYNPPYYFLIGKQINPEDASVKFRVKLKLPRTLDFVDMNSTIEKTFEELILQAIVASYDELESLSLLSSAEIVGVNKLKELILKFLNGEFSGNINEDMLLMNGFFPVPGSASVIDTTSQVDTSGNVYDYAGLKINNGGSWDFIRYDISDVISTLDWSAFAILTDNRNYSVNNGAAFESANAAFEAADEKIIYWFHYYKPSDTSQAQVYLKLKDNFTESEANTMIEEFWNGYIYAVNSPLKPLDDLVESSACYDLPVALTNILSWRTNGQNGDNLLNCIETNFVPYLHLTAYEGGIACGIIDGVLDNISMLADIAYGLIDFAKYSHIVIPYTGGSIVFFPCLGWQM